MCVLATEKRLVTVIRVTGSVHGMGQDGGGGIRQEELVPLLYGTCACCQLIRFSDKTPASSSSHTTRKARDKL